MLADVPLSYLYSILRSVFPLLKSRSIPGLSSIASKAKEQPSGAQVRKRQSWVYRQQSKQSTGLHWTTSFCVLLSWCQWHRTSVFLSHGQVIQGFSYCLELRVSLVVKALQCWYDSYKTVVFTNLTISLHLYISSKGLVSAKQLSQTSFTTLAASTSSLQFGLLDTDIAARRLTHS